MMNNQGQYVFAVLGMVSLLGGCATSLPERDHMSYAPTLPVDTTATAHADGSIYHANQDMELFTDPKAHRVGDILTVLLVEKTAATKKATTSTSKTNTAEMTAPTLLGGGVTHNGKPILSASIDAGRDFAGKGESSQSNELTGEITVTVSARLSNGNLLVRGEKQLTINQGQEFVRISGIVRPQDIGPDNVVSSTKVADARIAYTGRGSLADANSMGWLARFFNSVIMPY